MKKRVLWLCNHCTLVKTEPQIMENCGLEVFIPKTSKNPYFYTTFEYDEKLTIPKEDIDVLNKFDFYNDFPTKNIIEIINKYFDVAVSVMTYPGHFWLLQFFNGKIVLRAFGLYNNDTYWNNILLREKSSKLSFLSYKDRLRFKLKKAFNKKLFASKYLLEKKQENIYFGYTYETIPLCEDSFFIKRGIYLPISLPYDFLKLEDTWSGKENKIMYVCPYMKSDVAQKNNFYNFTLNLADFPHSVFGRDIDAHLNKNIQGFVPDDIFFRALQEYKCMFYDSQQKCHIRYDPFEAIIAGMPVIYLSDGLLDFLGGIKQPGICFSFSEAREKIEKIFNNDLDFIACIKKEQKKLLKNFRIEFVTNTWKKNFLPLFEKENG